MKKVFLPFLLVLPATLVAEPFKPSAEQLARVPVAYKARCTPESRRAAIEKLGGDEKTEEAILAALRHLKNTQNKDGSWTSESRVWTTAFGLLCFLGHGETAQSEEFGISVLNAITFLVDNAVKQRGLITSDPKDKDHVYEHAIAVWALAEAYVLCEGAYGEKITNLKKAAEVCGQLMINKQHVGGGWEYSYDTDNARGGDTSITGWHMLALKSCQMTGLKYANLTKSWKKGVDYLERMQAPNGGLGYSSPGSVTTTRAAIGALGFQLFKGPSHKGARKAIRYFQKESKFDWDTPDADLYGQLYAALAFRYQGGEAWSRYRKQVFPQILKHQSLDGSFENVGGGKDIEASRPVFAGDTDAAIHYRTCLATLILQTYYR
ncbi:MAG: terpene cyclase/mutase family protein [Akkermansiaceae bacterium]|jgi:hypothetical protein